MSKKMTMDEIRAGVAAALEQSIGGAYHEFVASITAWWIRLVSGVVENSTGQEAYEVIKKDEFLRNLAPDLRKMIDIDRQGVIVGFKPNFEAIAKDLAVQQADHARSHFIQKNTMKLENIIYNKSLYGVEGVEVTPIRGGQRKSTFEGRVDIKFSDGMQFVVNNQLVWKVSINGKHFYQYPTTFHNVHIPGGKFRAMVPEDEMLELADPDNIGKRISKIEEVSQEKKKARRDERDAKKDAKRQKILERYEFAAVSPEGVEYRSDPTNRELAVALLRREKWNGQWREWSVFGGGWFTDEKKAVAAMKKQQKDVAEMFAVNPTMYFDPKNLEYMIVPARKLPHSDFVGEITQTITARVRVERCFQVSAKFGAKFRTLARDKDNNIYDWYGNEQLKIGDVLDIEGVVEKHHEDEKFVRSNSLADVRIVR